MITTAGGVIFFKYRTPRGPIKMLRGHYLKKRCRCGVNKVNKLKHHLHGCHLFLYLAEQFSCLTLIRPGVKFCFNQKLHFSTHNSSGWIHVFLFGFFFDFLEVWSQFVLAICI